MLTQKQSETHKFIAEYMKDRGFAPSYQEIMEAMQIKSKAGVQGILNRLEERGFIRRLPSRARAIEIIRQPAKTKGEK